MENNRITLGSLFDGIGGFPLCAEISGIIPVWAAEIDPACVAVTKYHFPEMQHYGDVSKINGAKIPPVDIITFGSPCQDLSVAGKRKGIKHEEKGDDETTRSGLFVEAIRIIYEMRRATNGRYPTFLVWENVAGAFSSRNGRDFQAVLEEITKADIPMPASGRWASAGVVRGRGICVAWRLFDAQYWGVPQRRRRIYLIGSFGSDCAEKILFKQDGVQRYLTPREAERKATTADAGKRAESDCRIFDCRGNGDGMTSPTITAGHNSRVPDFSTVVCEPTIAIRDPSAVCYAIGNGQVDNTRLSHKTDALDCMHDQKIVMYNISSMASNAMQSDNPHSGIYETQIARTIDRNGGDPRCNTFAWVVRRLTPLECERLQGYPDYWTVLPKIEDMSESEYDFFIKVYLLDKQIRGQAVKKLPTREQFVRWYNKLDSDGTRYRQLGNSLAIPCALRVIGYIGEYIRK